MGIHQKSATIDIAQVKELSKLEGEFLARKEARDKELANIIKGEDEPVPVIRSDSGYPTHIHVCCQLPQGGVRDLLGGAGGFSFPIVGRANPYGSTLSGFPSEVFSTLRAGDQRSKRVRF